MKIKHSQIDESNTTHDCHVVVTTDSGKDITMYGEIKNGRVISSSTGASAWNSKIFYALPIKEQMEIIEITNGALSQLELPENY